MRALLLLFALCAACAPPADIEPPRDAEVRPATDAFVPMPAPIDGGRPDETCGLEDAAFCETFEALSPDGRGGDLDEARWGFARWGHQWGNMHERVAAYTYEDFRYPATFCGERFSGLMPGLDVRACDGVGVDGTLSRQLNEVFDDQGDFGFNSMMIRQPFDFTDRTGTITFDVDAKINPCNLGHGWWIEVWVTEDPQPMPYHEAPTVSSYPRHGVGFAFQFGAGCPQSDEQWTSALETVHVADDFTVTHYFQAHAFRNEDARCFRVADRELNRMQIRLSRDRAELWASDAGDLDSFQLRSTVENLDLSFSRGYVHFQHAQYNAAKDSHGLCSGSNEAPTRSQTYRWDNIGFDGPVYPLLRAYDVPEPRELGAIDQPANVQGYTIGWYLDEDRPQTFTVHGVDTRDAIGALLNVFWQPAERQILEYRINDGPVHTTVSPPRVDPNHLGFARGYSLPVPIDEVAMGDNRIELRTPGLPGGLGYDVTNIDLSLIVTRN